MAPLTIPNLLGHVSHFSYAYRYIIQLPEIVPAAILTED